VKGVDDPTPSRRAVPEALTPALRYEEIGNIFVIDQLEHAIARQTGVALDHFASALAMAAWYHFWRKVNGWMTDRLQETAEGARLARRAVELGGDDAVALTRSGHALGHLAGDLDGGIP
jgi:hypothetical protein